MQPVESYGLAETLKIIGKYNVLSTRIKWQEKNRPVVAGGPTRNRPGHHKNLCKFLATHASIFFISNFSLQTGQLVLQLSHSATHSKQNM